MECNIKIVKLKQVLPLGTFPKREHNVRFFYHRTDGCYYMYDEKFFSLDNNFKYAKINDKEEIEKILSLYLEKYFNINDDKQTWFDKIKDLSEELGYAREVKMFKQEPEKWKAHVGDVSTVLRVSLTGRQQTPDLYEIMQVLGKESVEKRFKNIIEK